MNRLRDSSDRRETADDPEDVADSRRYYRESWCLIHLLGERGKLKKERLEEFVRAVAGGAEPMDALPKLTGMTNAEFRKLWEARLGSSITTDE